MIKLVKKQKKNELKYYQMIQYLVKNLLPIIINVLKRLPSSGSNNYINFFGKDSVVEKQ